MDPRAVVPVTCPFCQVAAGDGDGVSVADSPSAVALLDANPAAAGHALVAPRTHEHELTALDPAVAADVFDLCRRVAIAQRSALEAEGVSLFYTTGTLTGSIEHAHVHLVPRSREDHIGLALDRSTLDPDAAVAMRERLDAALPNGQA